MTSSVEEPTVSAVEQTIVEEPAAVDPLPPVVNESDEPTAAKPKKAPKEPKPRKPASKNTRTHPTYEEV